MSNYEDKLLEIGKIPEKVMKRTVYSQMKVKRPEVLIHTGIGEDCSAIESGDEEAIVMSVDPITGATKDIGKLAFQITANDIASSGAKLIGMLIDIILPVGSHESDLRDIMQDIGALTEQYNVEILGGHTEVSDSVNRPV